MNNLPRDILELLIVVSVGGMLWAVIGKLRRREITAPHCPECGRPVSRAYSHCKHCRAPLT